MFKRFVVLLAESLAKFAKQLYGALTHFTKSHHEVQIENFNFLGAFFKSKIAVKCESLYAALANPLKQLKLLFVFFSLPQTNTFPIKFGKNRVRRRITRPKGKLQPNGMCDAFGFIELANSTHHS